MTGASGGAHDRRGPASEVCQFSPNAHGSGDCFTRPRHKRRAPCEVNDQPHEPLRVWEPLTRVQAPFRLRAQKGVRPVRRAAIGSLDNDFRSASMSLMRRHRVIGWVAVAGKSTLLVERARPIVYGIHDHYLDPRSHLCRSSAPGQGVNDQLFADPLSVLRPIDSPVSQAGSPGSWRALHWPRVVATPSWSPRRSRRSRRSWRAARRPCRRRARPWCRRRRRAWWPR